ncbi:MAG: hypothetical protein ACRD98_01865 [Nitrososphaera sp.]
MTDWIKFWPVIVAAAVGIMGYAQLSADVSTIKREHESVRRLPIIEHRLDELTNRAVRIEKFIQDGNQDSVYLKRQQYELMDVLRQTQSKIDQLLKK